MFGIRAMLLGHDFANRMVSPAFRFPGFGVESERSFLLICHTDNNPVFRAGMGSHQRGCGAAACSVIVKNGVVFFAGFVVFGEGDLYRVRKIGHLDLEVSGMRQSR